MSSIHRRTLSRRALVAAAPIVLAGAVHQRRRASTASQAVITGDCSLEPALQYVYDFSTTNFAALPLMRMGSMDPGPDWVISQSPELGFLLTPPDWGVYNAWANSFDRDGGPKWEPEQPEFPFWATTMVVAPDESAAYIYILGSFDNVEMTPAEGAQIARDLVMGPEARGRSLCLAEQIEPTYGMTTSYWIAGDRFGRELLISRGTIITSSVSGPSLGPGSMFLFDAFVCPRSESEDLVLDIYLKILYQLLPKGGGGDPTPTPTPTP